MNGRNRRGKRFPGALASASISAFVLIALSASAADRRQEAPVPEPFKQDRSGEGMITEGETLTLDRCISLALGKNPNILAAAGNVAVNQSRVGQARSGYYPELRAAASYSRTDATPASFATGTVVSGSSRSDRYTGSVTLSQNILDFGRTASAVDTAKHNLLSSREDLAATENAAVLRVKQAYYGVLRSKRNRDVAADVIKQFELHLEQAKGFFEVGTKAKIDVIKAEVDLSNAKLSLINAENALRIAWVNLNNAMGVPDAPDYTIEDNLSFQPYRITLQEATEKAFENRPDLRSVIARTQAAESNIGLARTGHYPVLSGNASYSKSGDDITSDRLNEGWQVGAALTIPLFSGFLTKNRVAEAKSALSVVKADAEALRQQILLEVREAFLNLQAAEASIATAELAAAQAKENLDLANGRYDAGVGSPIEVSDAFATYVSSQANYTSALANYKIAQAAIVNAMGLR